MPTITNGDRCVSLMQGTLVRPIARYPGSVATDEALKVAANNVETTLVHAIGAGDTIITVGNAARLVPDMLLSIDSEIVSVSSISGNTLAVVRGFDGTFAAAHSAGRKLSAKITAWHHNALAEEIKAIEIALGPALANLNAQPGIISTAYDFNAQTPGGTLVAGVLNTVTLAPVPDGVNATNTGHALYISGGTGAAEVVIIAGGTAVAGADSGTVIFTPANAHSGEWTIRSASAGIQEAIYSTALPSVYVPPGTHLIYGAVRPVPGTHLWGAGWSSTLQIGTPGGTLIFADSLPGFSDVYIHDLYLAGHSGNASEKGIHVKLMSGIRISNIKADSVFRAIYFDRVHESFIDTVYLMNDASIYVGCTVTGAPTDFSFQTQINNITHYATIPTLTVPEIICLEHAAICTVRGVKIRTCRYNTIGIRVTGGGEGTILEDVTMTQPTYGVQLQSTADGRYPFFTRLSHVQVDQPSHIGVYLANGTFTTIEGCSITGRNDDGAVGYPPEHAIFVADAAHNVIIHNNIFQNWYAGRIIQLSDGNVDTTITGNVFSNGSGALGNIFIGLTGAAVNDRILCTGNHFAANDATPIKIANLSPNNRIIISGNLGVDDIMGADIAVSGTNQTIQLHYPMHVLVGSGTVGTLSQSVQYRSGIQRFILAGGSSVSFITGGNIGFAATLAVGKVLTMSFNANDQKWYPSA